MGDAPTLDYGSRNVALRPLPALWTWTVVCALVPLICGVGCLVAFMATDSVDVMLLGILIIAGGCAIVLAGTVCCILYLVRERAVGLRTRRQLVLRGLVGFGLLLCNFPAAALCSYTGEWWFTRYGVQVWNKSNAMVASFVVSGPGFSKQLGPLSPGQRTRYRPGVTGTGPATYTMMHGGVTTTGTIDEYPSSNHTGLQYIEITSTGVEVFHPRD